VAKGPSVPKLFGARRRPDHLSFPFIATKKVVEFVDAFILVAKAPTETTRISIIAMHIVELCCGFNTILALPSIILLTGLK
jgi:hypothetical protein